MTTRAWMTWGAATCVLIVAVLLLTSRRVHTPAFAAMTGSCSSGLGTSAQCSEWSGPSDGKRTCQTLGGTWRDAPCPIDASSAGGVCNTDSHGVQGRVHYGSAWSAPFRDSTRAQHHCTTLGGSYIR
ncbi:MAG: hypothetical protein ABI321_01050 [Polyangia bacterium]